MSQDPRFARIKTDPRFKRLPRKQKRGLDVEDERFSSMFTSKMFAEDGLRVFLRILFSRLFSISSCVRYLIRRGT